jgi:glycosyltransferase involved in cell wall biosynthesis
MKKILIATPMMPPTPGGPSTHAKKLIEHFQGGGEAAAQATLFNFEIYKNFPSGIRHLLTFLTFINPLSKYFLRKFNLVFALDGFTVALPAVLAGIFLRRKVILRIGGDFVYEEFLNLKEVTFEEFYNNFQNHKVFIKKNNFKLYIKYLVQKFVLEHAEGVIFNTSWQKNIYIKHYKFANESNIFTVINPIEPIAMSLYSEEVYENSYKFIFTSITRDIIYKNVRRLSQVFQNITPTNKEIYLEKKQGSWPSCLKRISMSRAYICASVSDISPNQVLEAVSLKIPIIISKHTGITNILKENKVARVVDPFNISDMENAVLEMCNDEIYNEYKKNLEKFTWPQTWTTLFKQYESIISSVCNKS